jgi:hypothetical protein
MIIKTIAAFTVGILISGILFTLQTLNYRAQAELANLKLEVRITELEQQLEDAVSGRPSFTAVPTQADREALRFPVREGSASSTLTSENQRSITTSSQVTSEFINLLEAASVENDRLNKKLFTDIPRTMEAVQQKALTGNFVGFFEILNNAQMDVDVAREYVGASNLTAANLAAYTGNSATIADNIKVEVASLEEENLYYAELIINLLDLLDQTLTGIVPSQELLDEVDSVTLQVNEQSQVVINQYLTLVNSIAS